MRINEERFELNGKNILLRCARPDEADMLINYLKTVTGETRFLMADADEISYTIEQEKSFINGHNDSDDQLLLLVFVDGEYAGNCSFDSKAVSRRNAHRAGIGIALFQKHTGQGLGRIILNRLIKEVKNAGFEQVELTVVGGNDRAYHLYKSIGFVECGRIPNANKYQDGTYADDILMVMKLTKSN
ncbi:GNAT family N-acetyltransferase [Novisyntrophococcus fermenticellae]|uniref:GNAT family N-acetyltransferase n=1 Tax=Novisyntrophococcus fermenticellae TaxID=2068655 RepID=UPI001E2CB759|nr:GNAT family protein [Novisyntrophococcus fermenticellae]